MTKMKCQDKRIYGQFVREMNEKIGMDLSWKWVLQSDLKVQTEALMFAEQALRANYIKNKIDKTSESSMCRLCGEKGQNVQHLVCECKKLAQREYKRRHDNIAKLKHWKLCERYGFERKEKWYEHCPDGAIENDEVKLMGYQYSM